MLIKKPKQQGAALIAVLLILVVVTLLGISAMRMGLTGLTVATNSQISSLLFQAADKGIHNPDGSTGLNVSLSAHVVEAELTLDDGSGRASFSNGADVFAGAYASSSVRAGATCDASSQGRGRPIAMVADGPVG